MNFIYDNIHFISNQHFQTLFHNIILMLVVVAFRSINDVFIYWIRLTTPLRFFIILNFHLILGSFIKFLSFNILFLFPEWTSNWSQSTCRVRWTEMLLNFKQKKKQKAVFLYLSSKKYRCFVKTDSDNWNYELCDHELPRFSCNDNFNPNFLLILLEWETVR